MITFVLNMKAYVGSKKRIEEIKVKNKSLFLKFKHVGVHFLLLSSFELIYTQPCQVQSLSF